MRQVILPGQCLGQHSYTFPEGFVLALTAPPNLRVGSVPEQREVSRPSMGGHGRS